MANREGTEQRADEVTSEVIKTGGTPYDASQPWHWTFVMAPVPALAVIRGRLCHSI